MNKLSQLFEKKMIFNILSNTGANFSPVIQAMPSEKCRRRSRVKLYPKAKNMSCAVLWWKFDAVTCSLVLFPSLAFSLLDAKHTTCFGAEKQLGFRAVVIRNERRAVDRKLERVLWSLLRALSTSDWLVSEESFGLGLSSMDCMYLHQHTAFVCPQCYDWWHGTDLKGFEGLVCPFLSLCVRCSERTSIIRSSLSSQS